MDTTEIKIVAHGAAGMQLSFKLSTLVRYLS